MNNEQKKIDALLEAISRTAAEKENTIADLRVAYTGLLEENRALQQRLAEYIDASQAGEDK